MGLGGVPCPKPTPRRILKARKRQTQRANTAEVRRYVFNREHGLCRCCRFKVAESMHEIQARSLGGKVSKQNSIAVCGDGVRGCHGRLQRHEIIVCGSDAEDILKFWLVSKGPL